MKIVYYYYAKLDYFQNKCTSCRMIDAFNMVIYDFLKIS